MKPRNLSIAFLTGLPLLATAARAEDPKWLTSYAEAVAQAEKSGKPILADFTGSDWCGWCIKLKGEVFSTPTFQTWAQKNVVLLELDFPRRKELSAELRAQNEGLRQKYGVRGYPTILFLDAKGSVLARSGYLRGGAEAWIKDAEGKLAEKPEAPTGAAAEWMTSWDEARAESRKSGRPILADFTGSDWCGWCIKLDKEVFTTPEFAAWASKNVVLLQLDFPRTKQQSKALKEQNQALLEKYGVTGFPTILLLDAEGTKHGKLGYRAGGPKPWIEAANAILPSSSGR